MSVSTAMTFELDCGESGKIGVITTGRPFVGTCDNPFALGEIGVPKLVLLTGFVLGNGDKTDREVAVGMLMDPGLPCGRVLAHPMTRKKDPVTGKHWYRPVDPLQFARCYRKFLQDCPKLGQREIWDDDKLDHMPTPPFMPHVKRGVLMLGWMPGLDYSRKKGAKLQFRKDIAGYGTLNESSVVWWPIGGAISITEIGGRGVCHFCGWNLCLQIEKPGHRWRGIEHSTDSEFSVESDAFLGHNPRKIIIHPPMPGEIVIEGLKIEGKMAIPDDSSINPAGDNDVGHPGIVRKPAATKKPAASKTNSKTNSKGRTTNATATTKKAGVANTAKKAAAANTAKTTATAKTTVTAKTTAATAKKATAKMTLTGKPQGELGDKAAVAATTGDSDSFIVTQDQRLVGTKIPKKNVEKAASASG